MFADKSPTEHMYKTALHSTGRFSKNMGYLSLFLVAIILVCYLWHKLKQSRQKSVNSDKKSILPPSPRWNMPIFGHMWMLDPKKPYETVWKWGELYGPVFRAQFGPDQVVILHTYAAVKEAFVHQADIFVGRPHFWLFDQLQDHSMRGVINAEGPKWREQRRFTLSRLRDSGLGRPEVLSHRIQKEIDILINQLEKSIETYGETYPIDIIKEMRYCVANIISSICFGYTFARGDPEFENFQSFLDEILKIIGLAGPLMFFPWMRHLVPGGLGLKKLLTYKGPFTNYVTQTGETTLSFYVNQIQRHKEMLAGMTSDNEFSENDDFTSAYIKEMRRKNQETTSPPSNPHYFDEIQLKYLLGDLFFAGQETTVTTLRWGILFLLKHPEIQEKVFEEMKEKIGSVPNLNHRPQLPYLQAVVMEIQRLGNIVPFGVMHATTQDTTLMGYHIPRRTIVFPNLWAIHLDENLFPNPTEFNPDRFLLPDGSVKTKVEGFIPFSMGKRLCVGEFLAKAELFTILAALIWKFKISYHQTQPKPTLEPELGTTLSTQYFHVALRLR